MDGVVAEHVLQQAFAWLCRKRRKHHHNQDIWDLRRNWPAEKERLKEELLKGQYRFGPQQAFWGAGEMLELWNSRDALVLKAITIVLSDHLLPNIPTSCHHVKGHGGVPGALRIAHKMSKAAGFVCRSDVKGYYAAIDHAILLGMLEEHIKDRRLIRLLYQYLSRNVCKGENYREVTRGISLRSPLSPLLGALYLIPLDQAMAGQKVRYVRYMDDWLITAGSRWQLRRAVRIMHETLASLKLRIHPDKTFIGRIDKGFHFLGIHFAAQGCRLADLALCSFVERLSRLYERNRPDGRVARYVRRWLGWVRFVFKTVLRQECSQAMVQVRNHLLAGCGYHLGVFGLVQLDSRD
ncbi:MAG: reverse transcriptase/maturase family protein [Desulfobulbales bacterium]|nr:reverse transcriptase/maturase family protein [Desulfobulbales bacterium]